VSQGCVSRPTSSRALTRATTLFSYPVGRLAAGWTICLVLMLLAVPLGVRVRAGQTAVRFLVEFLTEGARPWLAGDRPPPPRESVLLPGGVSADLWRPRHPPPYSGLVLLHGLTPHGKSDARLAWGASLFARGGLAVLVPDLPALKSQRLRPEDADVVAAGLQRLARDPRLPGALVVVAVSVGAAPAFRALRDPELDARVRLVLSLGGYAEARELVRYFTTGAYAFEGIVGRRDLDPGLARGFLAGNLDLVRDPADRAAVAAAVAGQPLPATAGAEARAVLAVLQNREPPRVDALLAALPAETRELLDALSPARYTERLSGRLLLVHGRDDPAIPYTESLRLAAAAHPERTRLVLVDLLAHVEGHAPAWRQAAWDLVRLFGGLYEVFRG
jgi:pimeloyl-ACP methyl ester carboxylesterase